MKQSEVYDLLVDISEFYSSFSVTKGKAIAWQNILYFVRAEDLKHALSKYVKNEEYPPTIAGLLNYWKGNEYEKSSDKAGD